jgi:hypothetical protein
MSFWDSAEEATKGVATVEMLEAIAYRLMSEQAIYAADHGSKVAYGLVVQFERDFRRALDPFGCALKVNTQLRYVCAYPKHEKSTPATTEQTLLALVLRMIYDESARAGLNNEHGEVMCDLVELDEKYRQSSNRELASGGKLRELLRTMKRWGIAEIHDEEGTPSDGSSPDQPYSVVIRPAIADILGETALTRLALFKAANAVRAGQAGDSSDEDVRSDNATEVSGEGE